MASNDVPPRPDGKPGRRLSSVVVDPIQQFMHTEVASGTVLLLAAAVALVWANSPAFESYERLWTTHLDIKIGSVGISEELRHWVNDLLMAFFFFVVSLEIKRELVLGELRDLRAAALPLVCALGGMIAPALLYAAFNVGHPGASGWGVPMATDIAFAVGVLALVGTRAPAALKIFLLTLAVADDLGAIAVIAIFYARGLDVQWLLIGAATVVAVVLMQRAGARQYVWYIAVAGVLWLAIFSSGVHATIAGVLLGFLTPARPLYLPEDVSSVARGHLNHLDQGPADDIADEEEQSRLLEVARLAQEGVSPLARLQQALHPWTSFVILPLFALANAGVRVAGEPLSGFLSDRVTLGIIAGLVIGKPVGITLAAFIMVKLGLGRLPRGVGWLEMIGVGLLAGVGFTVAIFIAGLAFADPALTGAAKVGILLASVLAGIVGAGLLAVRDAAKHPVPDS